MRLFSRVGVVALRCELLAVNVITPLRCFCYHCLVCCVGTRSFCAGIWCMVWLWNVVLARWRSIRSFCRSLCFTTSVRSTRPTGSWWLTAVAMTTYTTSMQTTCIILEPYTQRDVYTPSVDMTEGCGRLCESRLHAAVVLVSFGSRCLSLSRPASSIL